MLTWFCALFLHDLTKGRCGRCDEASTFSTFGFALGLVPDIELDLGPVVCMMTVGWRRTEDQRGVHVENETHRRVTSL